MFRYLSLLSAAALSCAPVSPPVPVRDGREATVGCYAVTHGQWSSSDLFRHSDSVASAILPAIVQLHLTGRATPALSLWGPSFGPLLGTWKIVRRDSLVVDWSDGSSGVRFQLKSRNDSLGGTVIVWAADVHGVEPATAQLIAIHQRCR